MDFSSLSSHLLQEILQRLTGIDLAALECTCRSLHIPAGVPPILAASLPESVACNLCSLQPAFQYIPPESRRCILDKLGGNWKAFLEYLTILSSQELGIAAGKYHTLLVRKDGSLMSFGFGNFGVLGYGDLNSSPPRVLRMNVRVSQVSASFNHVAFVNTEGQVYTYGDNSSCCCGQARHDVIFEPTLVPSLESIPCIKVATGLSFTVALTREGKLYSFGNNSHGQLGHGDTIDRCEAQWIRSLNYPVRNFSVGRSHTLAITVKGTLVTFGYGGNFCLGHGGTDNELQPRILESFQANEISILDAASGNEHCIAMDSLGQVYTWGKGYCGALGHGDEQDRNIPERVDLGKLVPVQVCAGWRKTFVVGFDGTVAAFGWVYFDGKILKPELIHGFLPHKIVGVSSGFYHTLFSTRTGTLLGFGDNNRGQLGSKDKYVWKSPRELALEHAEQ